MGASLCGDGWLKEEMKTVQTDAVIAVYDEEAV